MAKIVLGLDIGGANLKAATSAGRAMSVPFAVWKQPEKLGEAIKDLVAKFPEAEEIAATMTAELCDCYETKREGVKAIVNALAAVSKYVRIWSTDGEFVTASAAKKDHLKVAAANWHALGTFAARFIKTNGLLVDVGTTTTDIIPFHNGRVVAVGKTDFERMTNDELLYSGWKRTPTMIYTLRGFSAAEHFATVQDAHIVMKSLEADESDFDTANGKPANYKNSLARLARISCRDTEEVSEKVIRSTARFIQKMQCHSIIARIREQQNRAKRQRRPISTLLLSGSGLFLAKKAISIGLRYSENPLDHFKETIRLSSSIGEETAKVAPAYAVAVLAAERS